jgi:hypothetical protein
MNGSEMKGFVSQPTPISQALLANPLFSITSMAAAAAQPPPAPTSHVPHSGTQTQRKHPGLRLPPTGHVVVALA